MVGPTCMSVVQITLWAPPVIDCYRSATLLAKLQIQKSGACLFLFFLPTGEMDDRLASNSGKLSQKIVGIAAGEAHTLALTGDGRVYSWGRGTFGRLGTGKESDELFPVRVRFDSSKKERVSDEKHRRDGTSLVAVAAGSYHSLALEDDGSVWSWGCNTYGQLGLNTENTSVPHLLEWFLELGAPDSLTKESNSDQKAPLKVSSIKAGGMMSLAIDSLGALWMWGNCPQARQNDDNNEEFTLICSYTPVPVRDFHGHTVIKVACGNEHIMALVSAGETFTGSDLLCYSWGNNKHGQLGLGDNESRLHPQVVETFINSCPWEVYEIACGAFHTAVLTKRKAGVDVLDNRECLCWTFGLGDNGQLGHGTTSSTSLPQPVNGLPEDVVLVSVDCGLFHTCIVSLAGDVWAWGMERGLGLCPDATFSGIDHGDALYPLVISCVEFHGTKFVDPVQVACGAAHTVLVSDGGYKLWGWGRGQSGVLGRGNVADSFTPCIAMWPALDKDFEEEKGLEPVSVEEKTEDKSEKVMDLEKRLFSAMEEMQLLQSKLALMERYAGILHACIFGKPFEEKDIPSSLRMWGVYNIEREWENMIESADHGQLIRLEAFYRNMLAGVKDKLMKGRIEELIKQCMRS